MFPMYALKLKDSVRYLAIAAYGNPPEIILKLRDVRGATPFNTEEEAQTMLRKTITGPRLQGQLGAGYKKTQFEVVAIGV